LPNRRAFEETLERELALRQRTGSSFTVVFVDLDNLKTINDRYGHQKGDEVIRGVGNALHHILRPYDFAGRFGGDEFALLLSGTGEPESGITTRIADAVARVAEDLKVDVSASVGVARCPVDGTTGQQLVACADARMYENKRAKR
jgi:diguanylate cyclase (GGDEF)-like protein